MIIDELFESPQLCPECGGISFSDLILAEKKDACYHKVKASAKVWPSAYASGRLVQCRKKGAANYGNKSEGVAEGKITLSTDPNWYGATVDNYQATGPVVNIPANQLVGFEPDDKMNQPKSKVNVEKIVAGLKQGSKLPPLLVRKYKNGYQVLDGHHRFWAYKLLGVKSIPAQIVPDSDIEEISKQGVAEAGFPGAPDVEMPPMNPSGDPQRDKLKQEYMDLHREIKSLVDLQYRSTSDEQKMQAKARIEQLNDRAVQITAILEPRQPPNDWQKKTYGFDDNWNKVNQGVAENTAPQLSVQQLATISDEALDNAYGYGRSTPGNTFGWQANMKSAAYAKQIIDQGVSDIEAISDAIHKGWNTTAQAFVQNPDQFDDTAKLAAAGKLQAKLQQRAQLMKQNYAQLPEEEKEKDRVVARALVKAIKGDQSLSEGMAGQVVFSGTGANGGTYEIIQSSPTDFMIHANGKHIDTYGSLQRAMSVLQNEVLGLQQGMAEGLWDQHTSIPELEQAIKNLIMGYKGGVNLTDKGRAQLLLSINKGKRILAKKKQQQGMAEGQTDYQKRRQRERDVDAGKPVKPPPKNPQNDYFARRKKEKDLAEVSLGDYRKKAAVSQAGAKIDRFFGRDDAAKVAAADQTIAKREKGLARADARIRPYTPPSFDAEKYQRDLTAKYPNIDELVADAERNRDPYYDRAEGSDYYAGREAEQLYQRLKQIQRVIQGLNESQADAKKKELGTGTGRINPNTGRPWTPSELKAKYSDVDFDKEAKKADLARMRDQAKQERLIDKLKTSLGDPRDTTSDLAKSFLNKGGLGLDFKPPSPRPTVTPAPAPVTVQAQPPGFTAGNLAQQPGMAQYMQQKPVAPKPAPNFAQGPAGYKTTTIPVAPSNKTPTAPAATPVAKKEPIFINGTKVLPSDPLYDKIMKNAPTTSESLTWSKNFDPGRSLYRQMKQDR
jgi:ParB-like chromosome segregation protein Spo0J